MGATTDPIKAAQAMELAEVGYPSTQISSMIGVPGQTIRDIIRKHGRWGEIAERPVFVKLREEQNKALEAAGRALAAKFWIHAEENIEKLSPYQAVIGGSILIDKAQLLAGLPTEITASVNVHIEAKTDELVEALGAALLLKQAEPKEAIDVTPKSDITSENR